MSGQQGKLAIVTGTGGLGLEIAKGLAAAGADVIVAGRNIDKGNAAVAAIRQGSPSASVSFEALDLGDLASVRAFAQRMVAAGRPVDILVNSAGLIAMKRQTTASGFEAMFGVNFLGHFALTGLLLPLLRRSPAPRVVNVVGAAYKSASIDFEDINSEKRFAGMKAGGQSMLAKAQFTRELQRRSDANGWGLSVAAADPGLARTELMNNAGMPGLMRLLVGAMGSLMGQSAAEGAETALVAATAARIAPGGYYAPGNKSGLKGTPALKDMAPSANDAKTAARLWDVAQDLTGSPFPA